MVLWHGPQLIMEERWIDTTDGKQETYYAFPGGKIEPDETATDAAVREVFEETGVVLDAEKLGRPETIIIGEDEATIFSARLSFGTELGDGSIVVWARKELMEHKGRGRLMPFTNDYVEKFF